MLVDHSTRHVQTSLFEGATDVENLCRKEERESIRKECGHSVRNYRADNNQFDSKDIQRSCEEGYQKFSCCRTGAHHQNVTGEACINNSVNASGNFLLCAKMRWPSLVHTLPYLFSLKRDAHFHNTLDLDEMVYHRLIL